ncbi:MAG: hypothetical protein JO253_08155 [Alphaproteobacteria bacterium]|nr:hypothetical protein [Alphaproteobacteria bacterium]
MSKIRVKIVLTQADLPANTVAGALQVILHNSAGNEVGRQDVADGADAVFSNLADDTYTGVVQRLTDAGAVLGTPVTFTQTVTTTAPPPPAVYQAPSSVTVSVEPD